MDARRLYSLYKSLSLSAFSDAVVADSMLARLVSSSFSLCLETAVDNILKAVVANISPIPIGLLANMPLIVAPTSLASASLTIFKEKLIETYSTFMSGDLIKYTADMGSGLLDLVNATDLLRHGLVGIISLFIVKKQ